MLIYVSPIYYGNKGVLIITNKHLYLYKKIYIYSRINCHICTKAVILETTSLEDGSLNNMMFKSKTLPKFNSLETRCMDLINDWKKELKVISGGIISNIKMTFFKMNLEQLIKIKTIKFLYKRFHLTIRIRTSNPSMRHNLAFTCDLNKGNLLT